MSGNKDKHYNIKEITFYLESSIKGILTGIISFAISHPFDVIKTRIQSERVLHRTTALNEIKRLFISDGLFGFFRGSLPSFIRYSTKTAYRWPLMLFLPALFNNYLSAGTAKILTALALGNFEALIFTPIERLKIYLMTKEVKTKHALRYFLLHNPASELIRGLKAFMLRQNVSWCSFLYFDYLFKSKLTEYKLMKHNLSHRSEVKLSFLELNLISFTVSLFNTFLLMPFDFVKTSAQKEHYVNIKSIPKFLATTAKLQGISAIFAGWEVKLFHYTAGAVFNVNLLYHLEQKSGKV